MGLNNTESLRVVFDLETVALPDAAEYLDPIEPIAEPDLSLITPAKNLVDPVKVAADLEKRKQAALDAYRDQCQQQERKRAETIDRCGLDPDLCQIVAIGWQREDWNEPAVVTIQDASGGGIDEGAMLAAFWRAVGQRVTIGYNQIGFDFPALLRRSLYLGVQHPFVNIDRYRTNHIDLQMRLSFNGTKPFRSLNWYCRRFGLDVPQDDMKGADIARLVAEGNWEAVANHCRFDVIKTRMLAERMGVMKPLEVEALS